jgi:hypothetical protein
VLFFQDGRLRDFDNRRIIYPGASYLFQRLAKIILMILFLHRCDLPIEKAPAKKEVALAILLLLLYNVQFRTTRPIYQSGQLRPGQSITHR